MATKEIVWRNVTPEQKAIVERDNALYEKYAKRLEREHKGEFVAIALDGKLIIGSNHTEVLHRAAEEFGAGQFALWKIGYGYELKWRRV